MPVNTGYPVTATDDGYYTLDLSEGLATYRSHYYTPDAGNINAEESKDIVVCLAGFGTSDLTRLAGCNF